MSAIDPIEAARKEARRRLDWFKELMALLNVPAEKVVERVKALAGSVDRDFVDLLAGSLKVKDKDWSSLSFGDKTVRVVEAFENMYWDAVLGREVKKIANKCPGLHLDVDALLRHLSEHVEGIQAARKPIELDLPQPSSETPSGVPWPDVEFQPPAEESEQKSEATPVEPVLPRFLEPVAEPMPTEIVDVSEYAPTPAVPNAFRGKSKPRGLLETLGLKPRG